VQEYAELIFEVKIRTVGQAFIDLADKYGGKTWRVYCEKESK